MTAERAVRRGRVFRVVRRTIQVKLAILFCLVVAALVAYLRLIAGPLSIAVVADEVGASIADRIGPGWTVVFKDTSIEIDGITPQIEAAGLDIRNPQGIVVMRAPYAVVSLDPVSLLGGGVVPRTIELRDLQLRALLADDGSLSFVPSDPDGTAADVTPHPDPAAAAVPIPSGDGRDPSPLAREVASLIDLALRPTTIVGAIDEAIVTNARLTLVGSDGRERVAFSKVGARFTKRASGERRLAIDLEGPRGPWRIAGDVHETGDRRDAEITAADVPLEDAMLLTGLSGAGRSDLHLSGEVSTRLDKGRLTTLEGRFRTTAGAFRPPAGSVPAFTIDGISGDAVWNEAERRLDLGQLEVRSGPMKIGVGGVITQLADQHGWRLSLSGRNAAFDGLSPADRPFTLDAINADIVTSDTGLVLDSLKLKGRDVDVSMVGQVTGLGADPLVRGTTTILNSDSRKLLRLWPASLNPNLRDYLVKNLLAGRVTQATLKADLGAADLKEVFTDRPVSDPALRINLGLSDVVLNVIDGLPPVTGLGATLQSSGRRAVVSGRDGRVDLGDGRTLSVPEASFSQTDFAAADPIADIGFRITGGADALAVLLRNPVLRKAQTLAFDPDPTQVRGRVDLRGALALPLKRIPKGSDLPLSVTGTLSDLAVDRMFKNEKIEGANLAVTYGSGSLAVKGEARISGSPGTIDFRQPAGGAGDLAVTVALDDAARVRRGLPSAPQITGTVPVKLALTTGGAKTPLRFEVDLTRASLDNLLPGWTKPAGKAGRITAVLDDASVLDLHDVVIESGTTQIRGSASLGADGGLERADITQLKIAPGDDLKAQIERSGGLYKLRVSGNVGDARAILKAATAAGPVKSGKHDAAAADLDVELAVNIMTGFNDEAMTGVRGRFALRKGELRSMQLAGQFRQASIDAQIAPAPGGPPQLTVTSADAGATLRFTDLYRRMYGGQLLLRSAGEDGTQAGTFSIQGFTLKNEPALRRIISRQPAEAQTGDRAANAQFGGDPEQVQFTRLTGGFRRAASRIDYSDVVIYGPELGFTLSGWVDTARDRTDITGTFVPAYGLNNAFGQIPIVGLILGGGNRNEGLFAVDFRVAGPMASPTLTINPLTAVAPGILRKLFGWMLNTDGETTGATAPRSSDRPASRSDFPRD